MHVRNLLSLKSKKIRFNFKNYYFPYRKWVFIDSLDFFRHLSKLSTFEISKFDMGRYDKLKNLIRFEEQKGRILIFSGDSYATKELDRLPFTKLQVQNNNTKEKIYKVMDYLHPDYIEFRREVTGSDCLKVGIYRTKGGWGDVQMVLSAIWNFKKEFPKSVVYFSCPDELLPLANNCPTIDRIITLKEFYVEDFDVLINLTSPCAEYEVKEQPHVDKNRIEIFASKCKIESYEGGKAVLTEEEIKHANKFISYYGLDEKRIIGIIPKSNAPARNWDKFPGLIYKLNEKYNDVHFLIFGSEELGFDVPENSTILINKPVREVLSLLSICNVVVGPDTGPMHSAALLDVSTVWIFTHIDGKIRTKNYKKCSVVQKKVNCVSYKNNKKPCWYSIDCGVRSAYPLCSRDILVDDVLNVVGKKLKVKNIATHIKPTSKPKILFRQDGTAGDVLLTTATIDGIKEKYPDYLIDYMTSGIYFDILQGNPDIDRILTSADWHESYDYVFNPHEKILNAIWSVGDIPLRSLYARVCGIKEGKVKVFPENYPIPFKKYVVVHTTSLSQKTYRKFDEVITKLKLPVVQIGSPQDVCCVNISLDLRGKTTYRQTAFVLKNAELLLGIDSFPAHCASAVGTPSIIVFGNTCARVCRPQFKSIVIEPDYISVCPRLAPCHNGAAGCIPLCIDTITSEEILQSVKEEFSYIIN